MRKHLTLLLLCCSFCLAAQIPVKYTLPPCGTAPGISPWLKDYASRPQEFVSARSLDTLYVGIQLHLLARDNGTGRFSPERVLAAFCQLNEDYAATGIRFYFKDDWNLINSTAWYQHANIPQGIDMMLTNNVPDALNAYFASNVAGNCGYNLPYAGVAVAHNCAATGDHTWAHEVGHALSLPHPFIGWEGKTYTTLNPTPDTLTYDYTYFHDTIDTQIPAPLDTALVEYLDGSNCSIAADLFCDTKPDYLSYRWNCDAQSNSTVKQIDPAGGEFYSDGTLFMSYSFDECQTRFSDEEVAAMRANLMTEKASWLTDVPTEGEITGAPDMLLPLDGENAPVSGAELRWASVPNATHYLIQYTRISSFIVKEFELVTTDTSLVLGNLFVDKNYYWRVRAFNHWYACTPFSPQQSFYTVPVTAITSPESDNWRCYPSLISRGQALTLEFGEEWQQQNLQCSVVDVTGRVMWQTPLRSSNARIRLDLPSGNWPAGVYHLILAGEKGVKTRSLMLQGG
ncbi:MAG: hypothetical protein H6575_14040 [Lewinellaceae bacterium]|nr:hypothetical protein [Lewinellaceae bacterium]